MKYFKITNNVYDVLQNKKQPKKVKSKVLQLFSEQIESCWNPLLINTFSTDQSWSPGQKEEQDQGLVLCLRKSKMVKAVYQTSTWSKCAQETILLTTPVLATAYVHLALCNETNLIWKWFCRHLQFEVRLFEIRCTIIQCKNKLILKIQLRESKALSRLFLKAT